MSAIGSRYQAMTSEDVTADTSVCACMFAKTMEIWTLIMALQNYGMCFKSSH